jgi:hypothetical protein
VQSDAGDPARLDRELDEIGQDAEAACGRGVAALGNVRQQRPSLLDRSANSVCGYLSGGTRFNSRATLGGTGAPSGSRNSAAPTNGKRTVTSTSPPDSTSNGVASSIFVTMPMRVRK